MKLSAKANYGNWVPANMMKMLYIATAAIIAVTVVLFIVLDSRLPGIIGAVVSLACVCMTAYMQICRNIFDFRKGGMMGFFTLEDQTGQVECLMFPKIYERYGRVLAPDQAVLVTGRLSVRDDEDTKLLADVVEPLGESIPKPVDMRTDAQIAKDAKTKLYLRMRREQMPRIQAMLAKTPGSVPVYINLPEEGITLLCPRNLWVKDANLTKTSLLFDLDEQDMKVVEKP